MSAFAVVNPRSGNGRTGREWKTIERALGAVYPRLAVAFSEGRGDVTRKVRRALGEGYQEIVAVGGDGTINEAVNGMFDAEGAVAPDAVFAFVTSGTGGDFRKSFGIDAGAAAAVARLKKAPVRAIDVGRVSCLTATGAPTSRYFVNIASFGMSGDDRGIGQPGADRQAVRRPLRVRVPQCARPAALPRCAGAPDRRRPRGFAGDDLHRRGRQWAIFRRRHAGGARCQDQ